jgi:hypothetical protein
VDPNGSGDASSAPAQDAAMRAHDEPRWADAAVDAEAGAADTRDAESTPDGGSSLEGTYALRVRFFGRSTLLGATAPLANELVVLARIEARDAALHMTTTNCRDRGYVSTPLGRVNAQMVRPELQPPRDYLLEVTDTSFQAQSAPALLGYDEAPPVECSPGAKIPRQAEQDWLEDTCDCPSSDLPPTLPSDCRVNDLDDDENPCVTIVLTGAIESRDHVRVRDSSRYVEGTIGPNRALRASYEKVEDLYQLSCQGPTCARTDMSVCPPALNPVQFVALPAAPASGGSWSCGALLSELNQGRYLPDEPLEFPSGC